LISPSEYNAILKLGSQAFHDVVSVERRGI
jgi:hypothetical protein